MSAERLIAVAIKRSDSVYQGDPRFGHSRIRIRLGATLADSNDHIEGDVDGFLTSNGRFLDRNEAKAIAEAAGQIHSGMKRPLLSSDVKWLQ